MHNDQIYPPPPPLSSENITLTMIIIAFITPPFTGGNELYICLVLLNIYKALFSHFYVAIWTLPDYKMCAIPVNIHVSSSHYNSIYYLLPNKQTNPFSFIMENMMSESFITYSITAKLHITSRRLGIYRLMHYNDT